MLSISLDVKQLYTDGLFQEVIASYKDITPEYKLNEWDYYYLTNSLYKLNEINRAYRLALNCLEDYPNFINMKRTLGNIIYNQYVRTYGETYHDLEVLLSNIDLLVKYQDPQSIFHQRSILKVIDILNKKYSNSDELMDLYLSTLNPIYLSNDPYKVNYGGNELEIASDKEKYYMFRSKFLLNLDRYEECLDLINESYDVLDNYHYDNDIWFDYRKAKCYIGLHKKDIALEYVEELLTKMEKWFFYGLIFDIYKDSDFDLAFKYGCKALYCDRSYEMKKELLFDFGLFLEQYHYLEEAKKHYALIKKIIDIKEWEYPQELKDKINGLNINTSVEYKTIAHDLELFWDKYRFTNETKYNGTIDRILPNGKIGFIKTADNNSYIFRTSNVNKKRECVAGAKVSFYLRDSYNKKKELIEKEATGIKI